MRVLVFGGRHFGNNRRGHTYFDGHLTDEETFPESQQQWDFIQATLDELIPKRKGLLIASGNAIGADTAAIDWARSHNISFKTYPANWNSLGKKAGPMRNQEMVDSFKPDLAIGFPGGKGTEDMKKRLEKAGIETIMVEYEK